MKQRPLGKTGIKVSEIGLGSWQLANPLWGTEDESEASRVVHVALDEGCNFFDTAPGYSEGRSELLLGRALKSIRTAVVICTKFGHGPDGEEDFKPAALRPALEASLRRLQTDYIDVLLLHNPPTPLMDGGSAVIYGELERLKLEGKLRAYGVSLDSGRDLQQIVESTRSEVAEVLFNVFHQEPLAAMQRAGDAGVGLIVKVPLDSGWLSGKYHGASRFNGIRERWTPDVVARRAALIEKFSSLLAGDRSMAHAALQFVLAHPEVSTVIPGAKSVVQVRDNMAAGNGILPHETVTRIRAFWDQEVREQPLPW